MVESASPAAPQRLSRTARFAILSTQTSPPCGAAKFSAGLSAALRAHGSDTDVIWVPDGELSSGQQEIGSCRSQLDQADVAVIQYGNAVDCIDGESVIDVLRGLRVPSIVIAHAVPKKPTAQQRSVFEAIAATASHLVVTSEAACRHLCLTYQVDRRRVAMIPLGATVPEAPRVKVPSRPIILTCALMGPGKGIEKVIDAMPLLKDLPGRPRYVVAGPTHPRVMAAEGEAYRSARIEQARRLDVADSVKFDPGYYSGPMLTALIQQAAVIALPFDSDEHVSCGVLVDAIANGRPVVASEFPHAVELLNSGAGIIVDPDDSEALAAALRTVIRQPRLAGTMAAEARNRAAELTWPVVAAAYVRLAHSLLAEWRSRA
ncbi:glycosyltransferase [Mycobacterium sp. OAS707]|uniref:glycosyltransferase n=1 Tax=Mycobacterium sp. OAS707 TaxID=2663822 RepID=UPI00178B54A8